MIEENYVKIGGAATDAFCSAKGITTEAQRRQMGANAMCSNDGFVVFHDSDLMCGQIGKNAIGKEAKSSLFYILTRDNLPEDAVECMTRLSKFCARWLTLQGYVRLARSAQLFFLSLFIADFRLASAMFGRANPSTIRKKSSCECHMKRAPILSQDLKPEMRLYWTAAAAAARWKRRSSSN
jgi:hypothetical protein